MLEARPPVLRPRPLGSPQSPASSGTVSGTTPAHELCRACAEATGGNPFLLSELLGEFRREARPANAIDPRAVDRLAPERIAAAVLLRVSRLDPQAPALARAVAVLGEQAHLTMCAELAGLDVRTASTLGARSGRPRGPRRWRAIALCPSDRANRDLQRFVRHRTGRSTRACGQAAGGSACRPGCDRGSSDRHTAERRPQRRRHVAGGRTIGIGGGAPDTAAEQLRRALAEPPDARDRPSVLFELGNAEHELGDLAAPGHLREAGETATDPLVRAHAMTALAWTTHPNPPRQREQLPLYEWAADEVRPHDRELALQLDAARLGALLLNPDLPDQATKTKPTGSRTCRRSPRRSACCGLSWPAGHSKAARSRSQAIWPNKRRPIPRWSARAVTRCGGRTSRSA